MIRHDFYICLVLFVISILTYNFERKIIFEI